MIDKIIVEEVLMLDEMIYDAVCKLLSQLTSLKIFPSYEYVLDIIASKSSRLFIAKSGEQIVGMLTIVMSPIPTGVRTIIEDVVVDEKFRGIGIGRIMVLHAIDVARKNGALSVDLTSSPHRVAANKLYQSLGFEKRETNVYRLKNF
jgi:ribosomal protein S18 acetylase RimI-like enzyme